MFTTLIKQVFPYSTIIDAALKFPITKDGWEVDMPDQDACQFDNPEWRLVLNLQDMLTFDDDDDIPRELLKIQGFYQGWADLDRIIVVIWPVGIGNRWHKIVSMLLNGALISSQHGKSISLQKMRLGKSSVELIKISEITLCV